MSELKTYSEPGFVITAGDRGIARKGVYYKSFVRQVDGDTYEIKGAGDDPISLTESDMRMLSTFIFQHNIEPYPLETKHP